MKIIGATGMRAWVLLVAILLGSVVLSRPLSGCLFPQGEDSPSQSRQDLFAQGERESKAGDFSAAAITFQKAREAAAQKQDDNGQAACLLNLGEINWSLGNMEKSDECYREAKAIAARKNISCAIAQSQLALDIHRFYQDGKNYGSRLQYQDSIKSLLRAIQLSRKLGSPAHEAKCLRRLSIVYYEQNDLTKFLELNQQALRIYQGLKNEREKGYCIFNFGAFYKKQLDLPMALQYLFEALRIAQKQNLQIDQIDCLLSLGDVFTDLGNYFRAIDFYSEAKELININRYYKYLPNYLCNIGCLYRRKADLTNDRKCLETALHYYFEALAVSWENNDNKLEALVINNLGYALIKQGECAKALRFLKSGISRAAKLNDLTLMANMLINEGHATLGLGNTAEAVARFKKAIDISLKEKFNLLLWEAYWGLGKCFEKNSRLSAAEECYMNSIAVIERMRAKINLESDKASFVRDKFVVYESLIHLLFVRLQAKPDRILTEKIFGIMESAKAQAFLESVRSRGTYDRQQISPKMQRGEEDISARISSLMRAISKPGQSIGQRTSLLKELGHWEDRSDRLMDRVRPAQDRLFRSQPLAPGQIQGFLNDNKTAVLEYLLGDERSYVALLTGRACGVWSLPPKIELENSIKIFIKMLSSPPAAEFQGTLAARRLCRDLLFPLDGVSPGEIENLVVVPDGLLYYLPYEALIHGSGTPPSSDRYLVEDYNISYAPSATSLLLISRNRSDRIPAKGLLAFADPNYDSGSDRSATATSSAGILREIYLDQGFSFCPLPYSQEEAKRISRFFGPGKADVFLREQASEEAVKKADLADYRVIHFACHGFLDERFPLRSALVLSPQGDRREDGFLQVREIQNLRTRADLIVLSACQTGRGNLEKGEGLLGLSRVFFTIGAKSVVSALWPINDQSTSIIMEKFYAGLARGLKKSQALRAAKLKMLGSRYAHPFYWATFILNGDFASAVDFR